MELNFVGFSKDGINWDINHEPIQFKAGNTEMIESEYKYDPRVTWIEDRYWVTWCNGYHGPTIGIAYTFDFKEFFQCENAVKKQKKGKEDQMKKKKWMMMAVMDAQIVNKFI